MGKFVISSHGRLQDWIAVEEGFFADEGLDFQMDVRVQENAQQSIEPSDRADVRMGAYELYVAGVGGKKDMSCACHWAVNQAAVDDAGKMWGGAYSILPAAIFVQERSEIRRPSDLAGVEVAVGYHSGSHFSTIQALEPFLETDQIRLRFGGMPYDRVDALLDGTVQAAAVWSAPTYLLEQLGCRKILDTTFVAGFMFSSAIDAADVTRYMNALRRAQMKLDLAPEAYKHYFTDEIPARYQDRIDVRCFGTGERIVFLPYTEDAYHRTQEWMRARGLFETATGELPDYRSVVQV
ncbi:MAG: ABC transporter substrate-binding protein [Acidimicrobiales bacterium]